MIKNYRVILFVLFLLSNKVCGQVVHAWGGGSDLHNTDFGICFQYISNDYKIIKAPNWRDPYFDVATNKYVTTGLSSISSVGTPGFGIGFIYRVRITEYLEVRTNPSLVLADRTLTYIFADTTLNTQRPVHATNFDIPLLLKIKSERLGNFRAYIIGGVKYTYGINKPKADDPNLAALDQMVENKRAYASYEAGIGFDIYFEYFKFSPELKISNSFNSVLQPSINPYTSPIDKLLLHSITFTINLE